MWARRSRTGCASAWRARSRRSSRCPELAEAKKLLSEFGVRWKKELPEAVEVLERGFPAAPQFYAFPEPHWPRLRTTNSLERLHGEIKRRIKAAGAFPDRASALRLVTAVALKTTRVWGDRPLTPSDSGGRPRSLTEGEELLSALTHRSGLDHRFRPRGASRPARLSSCWIDSAEHPTAAAASACVSPLLIRSPISSRSALPSLPYS